MRQTLPFDESFDRLIKIIRDQEVVDWVAERLNERTIENLEYLAKFAYMTGLINKLDIQRHLGVDAKEAKALVRQWYNDLREKGCGLC